MNQKTSKALRKATGFKVHKPREYERINYNTGGHTFKALEDRAAYQAAKKKYLEEKRK